MVDVDLDDIRIAFAFTVIQVLSQVTLGQQLPSMQHEIAQQAELRSSQLHFFAIALYRLPTLVQLQASRLQLRLIGQTVSAAQQ